MLIAARKNNFINYKNMEFLNLLDYLIPNIKIYSVIHQSMKTVLRIELDSEFPIVIGEKKKGNRPMFFNSKGSVLKDGTDCLLFPDKDTNTWQGYATPILFDKGDVIKAIADNGEVLIAIYSHFDKEKQVHCCFHSLSPDHTINYSTYSQVDKFRQEEGFFHAKKIFSNTLIGRLRNQNLDGL